MYGSLVWHYGFSITALQGIQMLYRPAFFIAMLVLLLLMTFLAIAAAVCLLSKSRQYSPELKHERVVTYEQLRSYNTPVTLRQGYQYQ